MSPVPVSEAQKESYRLALEALQETGLLPFILVIGSWGNRRGTEPYHGLLDF